MAARTVDKPWGHELIWAASPRYAGKILFIEKGHRLSRQYHSIKEESIMVLEGSLRLELGPDQYHPEFEARTLSPGDGYHILPHTVHRFCAPDGDVKLVEVSTAELHDIVRLEDDYKRLDPASPPPIKPTRFQK